MATYNGNNNNNSYTGTDSADSISGNGGNDTLSGMGGDDTIYGGLGSDQVSGGSGNDSLIGDNGGLSGLGSNDTISGGDGDDYISGGAGRDSLDGGLGNDVIVGDEGIDGTVAGDDTIRGGGGHDSIFGDAGDDLMYGDAGDDLLSGNDGNDTAYGGIGNDELYGWIGNDVLDGEEGDDYIDGGAGADRLTGGAGSDTIYGFQGIDTIDGGAGSDLLDGGAGNDTLDGGGDGDDTLTGGAGDDLFVISGNVYDTITLTDFGAGETNGDDGNVSNNDFVDLTSWYNDTTVQEYNASHGTNFAHASKVLEADAADGQLNWINESGGPTVGFTLADSGLMDTEHTGVTCFARGTMIETDCGPIAIEELQNGDRVETMDDGFQKIRWIGSRRIDAEELTANPKLRPILIHEGTLGLGWPHKDLLVSPQHRIIVASSIAERMFGSREVLVAAKQLLAIDGISIAEHVQEVEYFHFLFDRHQIVFSEGAPTEAMYMGSETLKSIPAAARFEILELFPELAHPHTHVLPEPARHMPIGRLGRKLAERHQKNSTPLLSRWTGVSNHAI